jgi:hypothetical protein
MTQMAQMAQMAQMGWPRWSISLFVTWEFDSLIDHLDGLTKVV